MRIDLYHDTVCPWCRIGKHHLDAALAAWQGPPPTVRYRPFFLDDTVPTEGLPFRDYFIRRKGIADPDPIFAQVTAVGADLGLSFYFDRVRYATNTLLSHRLLALAPAAARGVLLDAIHRAYFEEGRDIGDPETLVDLATAVGCDRPTMRAALLGDAARDEILAGAAAARDLGLTGVPCFVFDDRLVVSGAQLATQLLAAMRSLALTPV